MKRFTLFLTEATSRASEQAKKLNLKSDGHGSWFDSRGKLVAVTDKGRLKFTTKKPGAKDEGPVKQMATARADNKLAGAPKQKPAPKPKAKKEEPEGDGKSRGSDDITVAFGRFNPPTVGHEKLIKAAQKVSAGGDLKIYPSRTQDNKKNPLDPDMKVSYMRKMFPEFEEQIINDPDMRSIFDVLIAAGEQGYTSVNIVVGADRQAEFENLAQKYNGELYDFDLIRVVSAGVRDADAEGVEGMSASKLRKSVVDDDFDAFKRGLPKGTKDADTQAVFDAVRTGMKLKKVKKEVKELWQIAPKYDPRGLRENYFRKNIFNIGDMVESLTTGLIGKIIRRGTNYLISVTENNVMFKSWTHDLSEYSEKKLDSKYLPDGKPNTLVGTGGYLKYAMSMTPDSGPTEKKEKKKMNIKEFINKYKLRK